MKDSSNDVIASVIDMKLQVRSGEEMIDYLGKTFPQIPIRSIVTLEEAERFARSTGGRFPSPQYSERFQKVLLGGNHGVVLMGDALHAFPPDLGDYQESSRSYLPLQTQPATYLLTHFFCLSLHHCNVLRHRYHRCHHRL